MKKIFYWSPHISNVATIKNVVNSASSIKKFCKKDTEVYIIDVIGEWKKFKDKLAFNNIGYLKISKIDLNRFLPITGFIKSRIIFFLIFFKNFFPLKKLIEKEKPDYLIVHLITVLPLVLLLFYKPDTKFVLRISGLPKLTIFRKFLWKRISNKIYLVTCPSNQTKLDLLKLNIFPIEKVKILNDPILEIEHINKKLKEKNEDYLNEKKYFLNIGRLTKQKNQILLIKAFSKILKSNNNINLYIAGEGEERTNLENYIKLNKMENNIFLLGHIENVFPLIKNSLAVISSSLWEDPGAVMIESSYCQKNIISSNCPNGPEEFLMFGKGGYLFKNNDRRDLEEKINFFLKENENEKYKKILLFKKNSKKYTLFNHYKKLNQFLFLN